MFAGKRSCRLLSLLLNSVSQSAPPFCAKETAVTLSLDNIAERYPLEILQKNGPGKEVVHSKKTSPALMLPLTMWRKEKQLYLVSHFKRKPSQQSKMTRLFGVDDEFGEDAILGRLEGMKDVIEQVNKQFKDPDLTTFVCVCIPEFLSLYETERLVQELSKFEIDTHNIIINQVLFDEAIESKLLKARMRMQQKYLDQFYELYDDFHITKLPLLPEEVCGVEALREFSRHFITPYKAIEKGTVEELETRICALRTQLTEAEEELERLRKGKQKA